MIAFSVSDGTCPGSAGELTGGQTLTSLLHCIIEGKGLAHQTTSKISFSSIIMELC